MRIASWGSGTVHRAPIPAGPTVEVLVDQDAGGPLSVAQVTLPPGARMPEHAHGVSTALVVPLSGEVVLTSGDQQEKVAPGAVALLEEGEWVGLVNDTAEPVSLLAVFAPADFIQTFAAWPAQAAVGAGDPGGPAPAGDGDGEGEGEGLVAALEREHREIDAGIESFAEGLARNEDHDEHRPERLRRATGLLRRHIYVEEEFLFPPLRAAGLMGPIMVMLREHGELWQTMERLDAQLAAGAEQASVLASCREFLAQLEQHNSKEEPIVYPQVGRVLSEADGSDLLAFLDAGELPQGWVCQGVAPR